MVYSSFLKFPFNSFYVFYSAKISFIVRVFSFTSLITELQLKFQFNFPHLPSPTLFFFFFFLKLGCLQLALPFVIQESAREWGRAYTRHWAPLLWFSSFWSAPSCGSPRLFFPLDREMTVSPQKRLHAFL